MDDEIETTHRNGTAPRMFSSLPLGTTRGKIITAVSRAQEYYVGADLRHS